MHPIGFRWSRSHVSLFSLYCGIRTPSSYSPRRHETPKQSPCCDPCPCASFSCSLHIAQISSLIWWLLQIWDSELLSRQTTLPSIVRSRDSRGWQTACPHQVCSTVLNWVARNLCQLRSCSLLSDFLEDGLLWQWNILSLPSQSLTQACLLFTETVGWLSSRASWSPFMKRIWFTVTYGMRI